MINVDPYVKILAMQCTNLIPQPLTVLFNGAYLLACKKW
jgi:hypothetical protein